MENERPTRDPAKSYAADRCEFHKKKYVGEWVELQYPDFRKEIADAFRAGHAQGKADATRIQSGEN